MSRIRTQVILEGVDNTGAAIASAGAGLRGLSGSARSTHTSFQSITDGGGVLNSTLNLLSGTFGRLGATLAGFVGINIFGELVADAIRVSDEMASIQGRVNLVTNSVDEYKGAMSELYGISQETGTSLSDNANLFANLSLALKSTGRSASYATKFTRFLGQTIKLSGSSAAETSSVITQLTQALGSGVLRGEEFNSLMENGRVAALALGDGLGVTTGKLRQMANAGLLTTEVVLGAFDTQFESINTKFQSLPVTIERSVAQVKNSFALYISESEGMSKATSEIKHHFTNLANLMPSVLNTLGDFGGVVTALATGALINMKVANTVAAQSFNRLNVAAAESTVALGGTNIGMYSLADAQVRVNAAVNGLTNSLATQRTQFDTLREAEIAAATAARRQAEAMRIQTGIAVSAANAMRLHGQTAQQVSAQMNASRQRSISLDNSHRISLQNVQAAETSLNAARAAGVAVVDNYGNSLQRLTAANTRVNTSERTLTINQQKAADALTLLQSKTAGIAAQRDILATKNRNVATSLAVVSSAQTRHTAALAAAGSASSAVVAQQTVLNNLYATGIATAQQLATAQSRLTQLVDRERISKDKLSRAIDSLTNKQRILTQNRTKAATALTKLQRLEQAQLRALQDLQAANQLVVQSERDLNAAKTRLTRAIQQNSGAIEANGLLAADLAAKERALAAATTSATNAQTLAAAAADKLAAQLAFVREQAERARASQVAHNAAITRYQAAAALAANVTQTFTQRLIASTLALRTAAGRAATMTAGMRSVRVATLGAAKAVAGFGRAVASGFALGAVIGVVYDFADAVATTNANMAAYEAQNTRIANMYPLRVKQLEGEAEKVGILAAMYDGNLNALEKAIGAKKKDIAENKAYESSLDGIKSALKKTFIAQRNYEAGAILAVKSTNGMTNSIGFASDKLAEFTLTAKKGQLSIGKSIAKLNEDDFESFKVGIDDAMRSGMDITEEMQLVIDGINLSAAERAFKRLGIISKTELEKMAKQARDDLEIVKTAGTATAEELEAAHQVLVKKMIKANGNVVNSQIEMIAEQGNLEISYGNTGKVIVKTNLQIEEGLKTIASKSRESADKLLELGSEGSSGLDKLKRKVLGTAGAFQKLGIASSRSARTIVGNAGVSSKANGVVTRSVYSIAKAHGLEYKELLKLGELKKEAAIKEVEHSLIAKQAAIDAYERAVEAKKPAEELLELYDIVITRSVDYKAALEEAKKSSKDFILGETDKRRAFADHIESNYNDDGSYINSRQQRRNRINSEGDFRREDTSSEYKFTQKQKESFNRLTPEEKKEFQQAIDRQAKRNAGNDSLVARHKNHKEYRSAAVDRLLNNYDRKRVDPEVKANQEKRFKELQEQTASNDDKSGSGFKFNKPIEKKKPFFNEPSFKEPVANIRKNVEPVTPVAKTDPAIASALAKIAELLAKQNGSGKGEKIEVDLSFGGKSAKGFFKDDDNIKELLDRLKELRGIS